MRLRDIIKKKVRDQRGRHSPDSSERGNENITDLSQRESRKAQTKSLIEAFTDELTLNDEEVIDLFGKEISLPTDFRHNAPPPDFRDELTLNDADIVDLAAKDIPSSSDFRPNAILPDFRDELTLNDADIVDLASGKEVKAKAAIPDFTDDLTLTDEDVVDLTESQILPPEVMDEENPNEHSPDELTLTDEDVVDLAEKDILSLEKPDETPLVDHELVDELTLTDADIHDLGEEDEASADGFEEILIVEDLSDNPWLKDEDNIDFDRNQTAFPRENSEILKLTDLAIDALENEDSIASERSHWVLQNSSEEAVELANASIEAIEEEDTLDLAAKEAASPNLSEEIVELKDTAIDAFEEEDTVDLAAKEVALSPLSDEIVELEDVTVHSFGKEIAPPEKDEAIIELADIDMSAFEADEDTIIDFERRKPAMSEKIAEEIVELTEIAINTFEEDEDTIINIGRKRDIVSENRVPMTGPSDIPVHAADDSGGDTVIKFDRKKRPRSPSPDSSEHKVGTDIAYPKNRASDDEDILLFLNVKDTISKNGADTDQDEHTEIPEARSEAKDSTRDTDDNETGRAFRQQQRPPDLGASREIEREVEHLLEESGVFSKDVMRRGRASKASYEMLIDALKKNPDRIEPLLEQFVRKMISEKIESINIQGAKMNKGKLFDMIQQVISEEKDKLIKGLKSGGQNSI
ncbi:MAG: hypothetical protein B6245_16800 [Desulfobacteraceae bacterium 4572_88]|nr:MAG: hypothetical protein B6245_16800 [Desulfobacteraceae bacterium 4572_88]